MVANDIKCEAQQELRVVKRKLQEEEEKSARLQKELDDVKGSSRLVTRRDQVLHLRDCKCACRQCFASNHTLAWTCMLSVFNPSSRFCRLLF